MQRQGSLLVCLASLSALLSACIPDVEENGNVAAPVAGSVDDPDCDDGPDPCAGLAAPGSYAGRFCGDDGPFILTEDISCAEALENCILNAGANPSLSVECTWKDVVIFTHEVTPDACADIP